MMKLVLLVAVLVALAVPMAAADTGRTEINQSIVDESGGFPYTIAAPGSYVLTSDLTVSAASTHAIVLATNGVSLDLNGFTISGPATCTTGSCVLGLGSAIRGQDVLAHAHRVSIRNGKVRGFANTCVQVQSQARVDGLLVTECGGTGIAVSDGSIVTHNRVGPTGNYGIWMVGTDPLPTFGHNTISDVSLADPGFTSALGGRASVGNSCQDSSCKQDTRRRYYLKSNGPTGATAANPGICAPGFHFASLAEIFDTSQLRYDTTLGSTVPDSGLGPPQVFGWIRTGGFQGDNTTPGATNCLAWTQLTGMGTRALMLGFDWEAPATVMSPWVADTASCSGTEPIWCVED